MSKLAEKALDSTIATPDTVAAQAAMVRAVIAAIPEAQRLAVLVQIRDLLPPALLEKTKAPQRGSEVLNNVFKLFQQDPAVILAAGEVKAELAKAGTETDPQTVRNALNYLNGRSVLRRVGYGRYQLSDGRIVEGPP